MRGFIVLTAEKLFTSLWQERAQKIHSFFSLLYDFFLSFFLSVFAFFVRINLSLQLVICPLPSVSFHSPRTSRFVTPKVVQLCHSVFVIQVTNTIKNTQILFCNLYIFQIKIKVFVQNKPNIL